ncbi:MAG TPA: hypothetical protein DF613_01720 [Lachnospiraceae bacterium]|nr:hypothetical protein [Lachnospiraceae bacterium]
MGKQEYTPEMIEAMKDDVNLGMALEEIKANIEEQLKKCGLYYRLFSRVKGSRSLAQKIAGGNYGFAENQRRVQDLIGVRIVLYYSDDLSPCRNILEKTFAQNGSWSVNERTVNQFQATKINGVFEIPQRLLELVREDTWKLPVDATFEVQIRTVLFEGWHEIEHDMRYKDVKNNRRNLWKGNQELARTMNSILASLELCDWSLSSLFENLARKHLEKKNWELMLRSRYRLRMEEAPMKPELAAYLDENEDVARLFFNCDKVKMVNALMDENVHTRLTFDVLMKVLNDTYVHDAQVARILADTRLVVYEPVKRKKMFRPLENRTTFQLDVALNGPETSPEETRQLFETAARIIYSWGRYKYRAIFPEAPEGIEDFRGRRPGYELHVEYDEDSNCFLLDCSRIDSKMPGTLWFTESRIENKNGRLLFFVINTSSAPETEVAKISFRKPKFVDRIREQMEFYDVVRMPSQLTVIETEEERKRLENLIVHPARCLPVILVNWDVQSGRFMIHADKLLNTVGAFCHVYADRTRQNGAVGVYWPDGRESHFSREDILNSRFEYNRKVFTAEQIYELPFRHKLVDMVRACNNGRLK